jgi:hypothetical protein
VSTERQQSGLHWNASELLGSSPVVGSSLELVVSVPEDKEVSGEVELGRWVFENCSSDTHQTHT